MMRIVLLIMLILMLVISNSWAMNDLAGYSGRDFYLMEIDEISKKINQKIYLNWPKDIISISFSQDRSGEVVIFLGDKNLGWDEVQVLDNEGNLVKLLYSGDYISDRNAISNGNYIVYSVGSWGGAVLKNNKVIMEFNDNCRYKGLFGDKAFISRGNDRGRCWPFYEVDLITKQVAKKYDELNANGNFEVIDEKIYFEWCHGEGGNRVAKLTPNYASYYYADLVGDFCIMQMMGINEKYAFTLFGIAAQDKWRENMMSTFGEPKLFNYKSKEIIILETDSEMFENLTSGECGFDML